MINAFHAIADAVTEACRYVALVIADEPSAGYGALAIGLVAVLSFGLAR